VNRRAYIDWLRGIAVVAMIEWHVMDSWSLRDGRGGWDWHLFGLVGGAASPLFLFLAGLSVPLAIAAYERRGATRAAAAWRVQKRGWQVFLLAHVFRFISFFFNVHAKWAGLLRPDILNILGLGLAFTAWLAKRATDAAGRVQWLLVPALIIVVLTPFAKIWWWPTLLNPRLEAYIRPVGNMGVFTLFPWVALVPIGAYVGTLLLASANEARTLRRFAMVGAALYATSWLGGDLAARLGAGFWVGPAAEIAFRAGWILMALGAAWLIVRALPAAMSEPLLVLGRTSLFVYFAHVELAYGVFSYPLHGALPVRWSLTGFALVTVAMYFAGRWWDSRPPGPWIPAWLRADGRTLVHRP
jgi:uncharacterized membrane protein